MSKETKEQIQYLLSQYVEGLISPKEESLLFQILAEQKDNNELEPIVEELMAAEDEFEPYNAKLWEPTIHAILNNETGKQKRGMIRRFPNLYRYAASIIILLGLSIGGYIYFNKNSNKKSEDDLFKQTSKNDVAPGGNKALLTLSNGSKIILDSANNGAITQQGNTKIIKLNDGQLAYNSTGSNAEVLYNTITTPKGGEYQIILSDGSKVWLNAASSLHFPTSFTGNERNVELTGEGYFEIAKNASKPFHVKVNDMQVEVLGTHFNVNSYDEEEAIKTTLLEGSVKISMNKVSAIIKPGEQARLNKTYGDIKVLQADVSHETAWKDGLFDFDNDNIKDIMHQLERWYNVEVEYNGLSQSHYTGSIRRAVNISQVLNMLQLAGGAQFSIEGNKIIVKIK